jgi:hypothetical protein
VGVVDHATFADSLHVLERLTEKDLAIEAREARRKLEEEQAGITEDERGRLHQAQLAAELHLVWRSIVLHLLPGLEVILAHWLLRWVADCLPAAKGRQRLVRELRS